jgi:hypothetical protein
MTRAKRRVAGQAGKYCASTLKLTEGPEPNAIFQHLII